MRDIIFKCIAQHDNPYKRKKIIKTMKEERWCLSYDLVVGDALVHVQEPAYFKKGYHDKMKRYWIRNKTKKDERMPVVSIGLNSMSFDNLGHGRFLHKTNFSLPLLAIRNQDICGLERAFVIVGNNHPFIVKAPDGAIYTYLRRFGI